MIYDLKRIDSNCQLQGIVNDSSNIFLWHESEDINKKTVILDPDYVITALANYFWCSALPCTLDLLLVPSQVPFLHLFVLVYLYMIHLVDRADLVSPEIKQISEDTFEVYVLFNQYRLL